MKELAQHPDQSDRLDRTPVADCCAAGGCAGFSLLEVMISTVIVSILMVLLLGMTDGITRLWSESERKREASREARAGLRMLTEDLHNAVTTTNPETLSITPATDDSPTGKRIFFLVSHPRETTGGKPEGDLCAVGYFTAPDPETGAGNLYRFHAGPAEVSDALGKGTLESLYSKASPTNPVTTELLARAILRLGIRDLPGTGGDAGPEALLLTLDAVNGETARLLSADPGALERNARLVRRHLQRFSTIVRLPPRRDGAATSPRKGAGHA